MGIGLEEVMTYRVTTEGPLEPTDGSPPGTRQFWAVTAAELEGAEISAVLAYAGGDWMEVSRDGYWRPDVRLQLRTADGAAILMSYTGLVEQTDAFKEAASANRETGWDDQYMRMMVSFETGDQRYRWLNESLFVARGRILGIGRVEYTIYRLT
jgi:Protein of unknown function (DUF3237)